MWIIAFIISLPLLIYKNIKDVAKRGDSPHLYGLYGYFGLPGMGKTMSMCRELKKLRRIYGDKIYIMTNFGYYDEDEAFEKWDQLTKDYGKTLIVAWDEVQNEFSSRKFADFPMPLLITLTQTRKGHGVRVLYTSQRYHFVDKNFRSLTNAMADCRCLLGCFNVVKWYESEDYEARQTKSMENKHKIGNMQTEWYIQDDEIRNCYDSYKMIKTAKEAVYVRPIGGKANETN